jgi:hypothetical protein
VKVTFESSQPERKLIAVLDAKRTGVFLPILGGGYIHILGSGTIRKYVDEIFTSLLSEKLRTPIYEGDILALEFSK